MKDKRFDWHETELGLMKSTRTETKNLETKDESSELVSWRIAATATQAV
jgi:hypothetical protein